VRLRHQALTVALAAACACSGGCARLLGHILAPQEAALSAAGGVADRVAAPAAPARSQLSGVTGEVERLLNGKAGNRSELQRIKAELERRLDQPIHGPAAQDEPERLRPWHPRAEAEPGRREGLKPGDEMRLGQAVAVERGLARHGPLPDGVSAGELPAALDLSRIRLGLPRR
jgi:hypothetical protein